MKLIHSRISPYTFNLYTLLLLSHLIICLRANAHTYFIHFGWSYRFPLLFDDSEMIRFAAKHTHSRAHTQMHTTQHPICLILNSSKNKHNNNNKWELTYTSKINQFIFIWWGWGGSMRLINVMKNVHEWHFTVFPLIAFALTEKNPFT